MGGLDLGRNQGEYGTHPNWRHGSFHVDGARHRGLGGPIKAEGDMTKIGQVGLGHLTHRRHREGLLPYLEVDAWGNGARHRLCGD